MSLYYHSHGSRYVSMSAYYCHVDMDMMPCLHICHFKFIIHFLVGRDLDIAPCLHIIAHMDPDMAPWIWILSLTWIWIWLHVHILLLNLDMVPCLNIIADMNMDMTPCPHICHCNIIIPF